MNLSLNEVESTAKKAARGVGYTWGLADEAGKATRWLHTAGQDGAMALLGLLRAVDAGGDLECAPHPDPGGARPACPLAMGVAISDMFGAVPEDGLALGALQSPILILPFAASLSRTGETALAIHGPGFHAVVQGDQALIPAPVPDHVQSLRIDHAEPMSTTSGSRMTRAHPDPQVWSALLDFAARTYAPATAASRLRGAGAGLTDND